MLEGMRNASRHGKARTARIEAVRRGNLIKLLVEDDGVGFPQSGPQPWAIHSRVAELGGRLTLTNNQSSGARLEIEMPAGQD